MTDHRYARSTTWTASGELDDGRDAARSFSRFRRTRSLAR